MKPIIYPIAILTGIYASFNTLSLIASLHNTTPSHLFSKAKYEIIIKDNTKSQQQTLCPTELKIQKEINKDKNTINSLLDTFV
jgi:hypothetical protein